jgi:hypothetical protein
MSHPHVGRPVAACRKLSWLHSAEGCIDGGMPAYTEPAPQDSVSHAFDLFVVHAAADADFVRGYLLPALNLPSSRVLLADALTPGALVVAELDRGVSRSRFTVVVLSPAYLEDRWAVLGEQLASYLSVDGVHVIPLRLADCKLPLRLEARVALDFTDRANWESETVRLRELLHTTSVPPGIAGLGGRPDDPPPAGRPRGAAPPRKLELVDASFGDDEPRHGSSSCPVLDLKMINRSTSSIVVKRVDIHVQAVWKLPEYDRSYGGLSCSAFYDLVIPDRVPPFALSKQVSHVLEPDEAERFWIVFHRPRESVVVSMIATVVHGSEGSEESSGELLCAFRDAEDDGRWDADAQRTCVQLAREIRQRRGHMSKRLLELLEEMETGGRCP